jgi:hypothetical protein
MKAEQQRNSHHKDHKGHRDHEGEVILFGRKMTSLPW